MSLSTQQQAIIDFPRTHTGSLQVIARAGCGKTYTGIELCKVLTGDVYFGAYNKAIADEIKSRITKARCWNVKAGTFHSLGLSLWKTQHQAEVDGRKTWVLCRREYREKVLLDILSSGVSYAKQSGFGVEGCPDHLDNESWDAMADYYELWDQLPAKYSRQSMIETMKKVYVKSLEMCEKVIDFDDMLLAPLFFKVDPGPKQTFDWFIVDEAQDSNVVRRMLVKVCLKPQGRIVSLGDPQQSIYGFSGASTDSIQRIIDDFGCTVLPLSTTYRCPKNVVEIANQWVPDLKAHESAPHGVVRSVVHQEFWAEDIQPEDVVLCRNTRPLVGIARRLRQKGVPCIVEGDNSKPLVALATRWGDELTVEKMLGLLNVHVQKKTEELMADPEHQATAVSRTEILKERSGIIQDIAKDVPPYAPVYELQGALERMFEVPQVDDGSILRLCTAHRSKGREWGRVYLVGRNRYMPSKYAKSDWAIEQEKNLQYVAVTRAKEELVEVNVPMVDMEGQDWWEL